MVDVGGAPIDRYVVTEHLSEGGMGAIYVGKKLGAGGFEMEVVLKQLLPEFTQQEEFIDLFLREAKLSATLDHANIVHTIDLVTAGGEYFIVMEYLPGGDLRSLLKRAKRRGKRFSPAAAIYICREVLSALAYAHVKRDFDGQPLKLIHRDVSPSNILVSYTGEVKLTDFGIAKAATHNSLFYKVKGKIGYMSPEQAKSESLDSRSDLYSLAVCLYEVMTGERLFVHAGLTTSADEIYSQPVPLVSRKVPGLTTDMDAIMARALSLSPTTRYQTAGEFQEALTRCAHRNGLLMSAPELSKELLAACGPTEQWRADDDDEDLGYVRRAGTEVYDAAEEEDEDSADHGPPPGMSGPLSIHSIAARVNDARHSRPGTEIGKYAGVELTSIINIIDLENQGRMDSGPRVLDSGPRLLDPRAPSAPLPIPAPPPSSPLLPQRTEPRTLSGPPPPQQPPSPRTHGGPQPPPQLPQPRTHGGQQPLQAEPQPLQPRTLQPRTLQPRTLQPRTLQPRTPEPRTPEPRTPEPRTPEPRTPEPRTPEPRTPGVQQMAPHGQGQQQIPRGASVPQQFHAVPPRGAVVRRASTSTRRRRSRTVIPLWAVVVAILLAAGVAAVIIAMSGPDVAVTQGK